MSMHRDVTFQRVRKRKAIALVGEIYCVYNGPVINILFDWCGMVNWHSGGNGATTPSFRPAKLRD